MKMKNKFIAIAFLAMGFSIQTFAQSSATAEATATLVNPISIVATTNMDFGTIAASNSSGSVVLTTGGVATPNGGVTLVSGTPSAALFTVSGEGGSGFSINYPPASILLNNGSDVLTVNAFTYSNNGDATGTLSGVTGETGTSTIAVGATLVVPAGAKAGIYTNTNDDFTLTVNYN
jgi:Domain of unknown function (DUF4402)